MGQKSNKSLFPFRRKGGNHSHGLLFRRLGRKAQLDKQTMESLLFSLILEGQSSAQRGQASLPIVGFFHQIFFRKLGKGFGHAGAGHIQLAGNENRRDGAVIRAQPINREQITNDSG